MAFYRREVAAFRYDTKKLKYLMIGKPQYGANERGIDRVTVDQPRYVRITDIDDYGRLKGGLGVAAENVDNKYLLNKGDLLFARSGNTVGKAYLHKELEEACLFAGYMIRFQFDQTKVLTDFVFLCTQLQFYKHWVSATQRATGQPNINAEEYRNLEIPVPSIPFQQELSLIYDKSLNAFEARQAEAFNLLNSIDGFLLSELGINLPTEPESNIENRVFTTRRRELAGFRFDPLFHSFKLWHAIEDAHVPCKKLGILCHYIKTGFAAGGNMQLFDDDGVIQLRPTNINQTREWTFDRNIYLSKALLEERPSDVVKPGEVLFNNTNSQELVGKTAYMDIESQPFFCSNHMTRIATLETELNPEYLASVLNAYQRLKVFFSLCTNWNNQSGINVDLLHQLPIPVPGIHTQERIAAHIRDVRQEAKRLRQQAEAELNQAKQKIEAMLLGESV